MPAQATINPKLEIVENASTFFASFWAMAIKEVMIKVKPPIKLTMVPQRVPFKAGARRINKYTPALTMVALCSRALEGVGATMAPNSQVEKGSWALLVNPARQSMPMIIGLALATI